MKTMILSWALEALALSVNGTEPTTLGDHRYRVRESAARQLERSWPLSDPHLRAGVRSRDPEIAGRCASIRSAKMGQVIALPPWCDWLLWSVGKGGWDHGSIPSYARLMNSELRKWESCGYPWENYRQVSLVWGTQALQCGIPPSAVRMWFAVGRRVDQEYERKRLQNAPIE